MSSQDITSQVGAQTLFRGLAIIEAVAQGEQSLAAIGAAIGCTRSTTHRLVTALAQAGYLRLSPQPGGTAAQKYILGSKLIELGFHAREMLPLGAMARPHIEALAILTQDAVHLGVAEDADVLYLDKIPSRRGLEMRSRIGKRMPLALTGIGKALILDMPEARWRMLYDAGRVHPAAPNAAPAPWPEFLAALRGYAAEGVSFDLEENEIGIRCVAAPVRDASGEIVAAISVTSATPFMSEQRMHDLAPDVLATAFAISGELGWSPRRSPARAAGGRAP